MSMFCTDVPLTNAQRLNDWTLKRALLRLNQFLRKANPALATPDNYILAIYDATWPSGHAVAPPEDDYDGTDY